MVPCAGVPTTLGAILKLSTANSTEMVWSAVTAAKMIPTRGFVGGESAAAGGGGGGGGASQYRGGSNTPTSNEGGSSGPGPSHGAGNMPHSRTPGKHEGSAQGKGKNGGATTTTAASGKETVAPAPAAEVSPFHLAGSLGYYSLYMFRGLDVGYQTGIDKANKNQAFLGTNVAASYQNFALSFWYMNSLDSYVPGGAGFDNSFGKITHQKDPVTGKMVGVYNNQYDYHTPQRVRYQEYDLSPSYTFKLTDTLAITPGMNFYFFNDGRFWAHNGRQVSSTEEVGATVNWTGVKYLNQTLSYYYDFDAFNGGFMEYRVSTVPIKLLTAGPVAVGLVPSVGVSYDFHYNNHASNGWNAVEPGINMPVKLSDGLILDFGAHYSAALSNNRAEDRYWFTAAFQYTFPNAEAAKAPVTDTMTGKTVAAIVDEDGKPGRWHMTTGAGIRNLSTSFHVGAAPGYFDGRTGSGDLFVADQNHNANYRDGSVLAASNPYSYVFRGKKGGLLGDADFTVENPSQVTDSGSKYVQQVTFNSQRFNTSGVHSFSQKDDDSAVSPFVSLGYDVLNANGLSLSVGAGYSYAKSFTESGARLVGVSNQLDYNFIYNVNPVWNSQAHIPAPTQSAGQYQYSLVYNGTLLINALNAAGKGSNFPNLTPQQQLITTPVAAFRSAKLDEELHTFSIPIDLTYDITNRLQARLSVGPTFNFFDIDLTTTTDYQQLDPVQSGVRTIYGNPVQNAGTASGGAVNLTTVQLGAAPKPTITGAASATKGSNSGTTRALPGKNLAHVVNTKSTQKFQVGAFAEVALQLDLDPHKRWYAELYGRYDYVPKFSVSDGSSSASIDAASFGAGAGIGVRF